MAIQTTFPTKPGYGFAGMLADSSFTDKISCKFARQKLYTLTPTAVDSTVYKVRIATDLESEFSSNVLGQDYVTYSFTSGGSTTATLINAGLIALINAGSQPVVASGTTTLVIKSKIGQNFLVDSVGSTGVIATVETQPFVNALPIGVLVVIDATVTPVGPIDIACRLPTATGDVTGTGALGVVLEKRSSESLNYRGNTMVTVLAEGRVWVVVEEAVNAGDAAFVRFAAGAGGTQLGAFRKSADTASAVALPGSRYMTTAAAGALAILELQG